MTPNTNNGADGFTHRNKQGILMQMNLARTGLIEALSSNRATKPKVAQVSLSPEFGPVSPPAANATTAQPPAALSTRLSAHLEYESKTQNHQGAIGQYLLTQYAAKRDEIQRMVGIDVYA